MNKKQYHRLISELSTHGYHSYTSRISNAENIYQKKFRDQNGACMYFINVEAFNFIEYPNIPLDAAYGLQVKTHFYNEQCRQYIVSFDVESHDEVSFLEQEVARLWQAGGFTNHPLND